MKRNVGKLDRIFRMTIALFLVLLVLSNYVLGAWAIFIAIVAIIMFVTSVFAHCPVYSMLDLTTNKN